MSKEGRRTGGAGEEVCVCVCVWGGGGLEMGKGKRGVYFGKTTSDGSLSPSLYLYHHSPWTHVSKTEEKVSCKSSYTNLCMYI